MKHASQTTKERSATVEITSFSPLIMTRDSESIQQLFEELGFTKRHEKKDVTEDKSGGFRMKDEAGHGISIAQVDRVPQDFVVVQMNVRDFDEAMGILEAHGFKNMNGEGTVIDTGSSKTAIMMSPSGFAINVVYHVRK